MIYTQHRIGSCLSFISTPSLRRPFPPVSGILATVVSVSPLSRFFFVLAAGCCITFWSPRGDKQAGPCLSCSPSFLFVSGLDLDFFFSSSFSSSFLFLFSFAFVLLPILLLPQTQKKVSFHFWSSFFSPFQIRSIKLGSHTQRGIRQRRSHRNAG
jgi:hypothetical protein